MKLTKTSLSRYCGLWLPKAMEDLERSTGFEIRTVDADMKIPLVPCIEEIHHQVLFATSL